MRGERVKNHSNLVVGSVEPGVRTTYFLLRIPVGIPIQAPRPSFMCTTSLYLGLNGVPSHLSGGVMHCDQKQTETPSGAEER